MNDKMLLDKVMDQLKHCWEHGYYLDEKDISDAILLLYKASEYGMGKDKMVSIVKETLEKYV